MIPGKLMRMPPEAGFRHGAKLQRLCETAMPSADQSSKSEEKQNDDAAKVSQP